MKITHEKIEQYFGDIDSAVSILQSEKEMGGLAYLTFNGVNLYSDSDTIDSAYIKITGKTKSEFAEAERIRREEYEEEQRKHKEATPELTKEWIEKGNAILDETYHEYWAQIVPIRLGDLYHGMELKCCLDIVSELNKGCSLEEAKKIIEGQGHSGMSFGLVINMVKAFCVRGNEFFEFAGP